MRKNDKYYLESETIVKNMTDGFHALSWAFQVPRSKMTDAQRILYDSYRDNMNVLVLYALQNDISVHDYIASLRQYAR